MVARILESAGSIDRTVELRRVILPPIAAGAGSIAVLLVRVAFQGLALV